MCLLFLFLQNDKIERRVKSAGAGASRALSERVQLYRTSPVARAELDERCMHHLKVSVALPEERNVSAIGW